MEEWMIVALLISFFVLNLLWIINAIYDLSIKRKNLKLQNLKYKDITDWIKSKPAQEPKK